MIFTARMQQLIAVVLDQDVQKVTRELLRQGVMHFISIHHVAGGMPEKVQARTLELSQERIGEARKRIDSFLAIAGYSAAGGRTLDVSGLSPVDLDESNRTLDRIAADIQGVRERQRNIQQEVLKLEDLRRQIDQLSDLQMGVQGRPYSFLNVQAGSVARTRLEPLSTALQSLPSVQLTLSEAGGRVNLLLITMRRDESRVSKTLSENGWIDTDLSPELQGNREEVLADLDGRLTTLRREQESLSAEVQGQIDRHRPMLEQMWANLRLNELYYRIQSYFGRTRRTVLFSGWVPAAQRRELEAGVRQAAAGRCYLEWHDAQDAEVDDSQDVPVQFRNPRVLAPFQMLVQNYSIPEYGTIEPTPFVAVAYLIMFGLMFGDAGQGLVLAVAGLLGSRYYPRAKEGMRNLMKLVGWCGLASIVSGALFGSYFGFRLLPPLWFDFHGAVMGRAEGGLVRDVYGILLITIWFGITVIAFGLLLNWINLVIKKEWLRLALDKGGILGSWIYAGGVYAAFYFGAHGYKALPPTNRLFLLVGLPALLLMLKPPLEYFLGGAGHHGRSGKRLSVFSFLEFGMEWIVEMLEIFSGYLANTLSFMRVAGLGIAHVSLMVAFFQIAGMVGGGSTNVWTVLLLIVGNVLVIGLEGLSAGIQSLRLNYYEFFSKYFRGAGKAYMPVSLRNQEA